MFHDSPLGVLLKKIEVAKCHFRPHDVKIRVSIILIPKAPHPSYGNTRLS